MPSTCLLLLCLFPHSPHGFSSLSLCPFCLGPSLTLTEQVELSPAAVYCEWLSGRRPTATVPGASRLRVISVMQQKPDSSALEVGDEFEIERFRDAVPGDRFVVMSTTDPEGVTSWTELLRVTPTSYKYLRDAPEMKVAIRERLRYFLPFLEHQETLIALDAYGEFANAPYEDIYAVRDILPRALLRKWVTDPNTAGERLGLYGLLLGLCGTADDARAMEQIIVRRTDSLRLGLDGIIGGYLLLTGAAGLDVIDRTKLDVPNAGSGEEPVPISEIHSVIQAIRFMWEYGQERIPRPRLVQSTRLLLRPGLAAVVIPDLARWKDWESADRLFDLYQHSEADGSLKRAVVLFMHHCTKDHPEDEPAPKHVRVAREYLTRLKKMDPRVVRSALLTGR